MDKEFQTSFIPKKSLSEEKVQSHSAPVSIFVFLGTLLFFASLAAAIGVYFYKSGLERQVVQMADQLEKARMRFQPSLITDLETLDRRLQASEKVLANHIVITPVFDVLETLTLKTIRYTAFTYTQPADGTADITVSMRGYSASGYTPIALQSDRFLQNKYIKDPIFSNLVVDATGKVNFDLTFSVEPSFISYEEYIAREQTISDDTATPIILNEPTTPPPTDTSNPLTP